MMKDDIKVPGVAWWILAGILIPVIQAWFAASVPGQPDSWGAACRWRAWRHCQVDRMGTTAQQWRCLRAAAARCGSRTDAAVKPRRGMAWWLLADAYRASSDGVTTYEVHWAG